MSFEVTDWPRADDIERYRQQLGVPPDAVIRDIARLVTIAEMVHRGDLNEDWVLTGGMAMRLRGSPRFTMADTDTSRRLGALHRDRIAEALTVDQDELTVTPADATGWKPPGTCRPRRTGPPGQATRRGIGGPLLPAGCDRQRPHGARRGYRAIAGRRPRRMGWTTFPESERLHHNLVDPGKVESRSSTSSRCAAGSRAPRHR